MGEARGVGFVVGVDEGDVCPVGVCGFEGCVSSYVCA